MASNVESLKLQLTSGKSIEDPFALLANVATLTNVVGRTPEVRDLIIRLLERSEEFSSAMPVLVSLARDHGLFPYLDVEALSLPDLIAYEMHRPAGMPGVVFHRMQGQVYRELMTGRSVVLSAPTSFGKSLIVDALIASGNYKNVAIIVPTIALIDETRRRLSRFKGFKIITHPGQGLSDRNLFVLTQERFLALDAVPDLDLFFVDEFYKLDSDDPRAELLNRAVYVLMKTGAQFYFAAPTIDGLAGALPKEVTATFIRTEYATVAADIVQVHGKNDEERRVHILRILKEVDGPTLIYCQSPSRVRMVAGWLLEDCASAHVFGPGMASSATWISREYNENWTLPKALRLGIGMHHGRLPRWMAQHIVEGFNAEKLGVLICTNTLIEGVNTRAKNVIILDRNIAKRAYDYFTFANIKGRGGRMLKHFVGKIFVFHDPPARDVTTVDMPGLSQSETATDGLLLSIDDADRTAATSERLFEITGQEYLSVATMRENKGVDPQAQIDLAKHLQKMPMGAVQHLRWSTPYPKWDELSALIELMWTWIPPLGRSAHAATSARQLTYLVTAVGLRNGDSRAIVDSFIEDSNSGTTDEAIEKAMDFVRFWLDHNLPNLIRVVDRIAKEVLPKRGIAPGDFTAYAARLEAGFHAPSLLALEEYGVPVQVSEKLLRYMPPYRDLDELLENLRALDVSTATNLTEFEAEVIASARNAL